MDFVLKNLSRTNTVVELAEEIMSKITTKEGTSDWGDYNYIMSIIKEGDIIEIDRITYNHFAMFYGKGTIGNDLGQGIIVHTYKDIKSGQGIKSLNYLKEEIQNSKCRINNLTVQALKRGLTERPIIEQLDAACGDMGNNNKIFFPYSLTASNCEHAVTFWKYGKAFSQQVKIGALTMDALIDHIQPFPLKLITRSLSKNF